MESGTINAALTLSINSDQPQPLSLLKISRAMNQSLSNAQRDVASKNKSPSEILRASYSGWLHNLLVKWKRVKETSESSRNDTLRVKGLWVSILSLASLTVWSSSAPSRSVSVLDPVQVHLGRSAS